MKKEKYIKNSQDIKDIKDMNGEPKVRHSMSEEREVDIRRIVGSKGKGNKD